MRKDLNLMVRRMCGVLALSPVLLLAGCIGVGDFINPTFAAALGVGDSVAAQPNDAPLILVAVENRTERFAEMVVSYRDGDDNIVTYTTFLAPGDRSAQTIVCPVTEITLGSISNLTETGSRVALVNDITGIEFDDIPYLDVEAFGVLLREDINFSCGDEITFVVQRSDETRSGYQTIAFFRRSAAPN